MQFFRYGPSSLWAEFVKGQLGNGPSLQWAEVSSYPIILPSTRSRKPAKGQIICLSADLPIMLNDIF